MRLRRSLYNGRLRDRQSAYVFDEIPVSRKAIYRADTELDGFDVSLI